MDSLQLFSKKIAELECLPEKPKIFWYPSAGQDFRGPVAFTSFHINHELKHHGREYPKPDLYVYNSLGEELLELKNKLSIDGDEILFQDHSTSIIAKNFNTLELNVMTELEISYEYIDTENLNLNEFNLNKVFYFELEICGENYAEIKKVLYFQAENNDFFQKIILNNFFKTDYLCATQEGLAWGRCYKSIIECIFNENQFEIFNELGFKPIYFILSVDFTKTLFDNYVEASNIFSAKKYGKYISKLEFEEETIIYKAKYLKSQMEANLIENY